jgi:uncharacterized protein (DUF2249 family)
LAIFTRLVRCVAFAGEFVGRLMENGPSVLVMDSSHQNSKRSRTPTAARRYCGCVVFMA